MSASQADWPWDELGLDGAVSEAEVRRAYARKLKTLDVDGQPETFETLRRAYEMALALSPDNPSILNNLGLSYLMAGDKANAAKYLMAAAQAPGADARVRANLALVSDRGGTATAKAAPPSVDRPASPAPAEAPPTPKAKPFEPLPRAWVDEKFGSLADGILKENENDVLGTFDPQNIVDHWDEIRAIIAEIPSAEELAALCEKLGAFYKPEQIGIDPALSEDMLSVSAAIRNRLTLIRMRRVLDFGE